MGRKRSVRVAGTLGDSCSQSSGKEDWGGRSVPAKGHSVSEGMEMGLGRALSGDREELARMSCVTMQYAAWVGKSHPEGRGWLPPWSQAATRSERLGLLSHWWVCISWGRERP